jgi:HTH-type transcriptional regulator, transcriptional repressor of NAD biosynthesis genes
VKIGIVGAECCGKSTLSTALHSALQARYPGIVLVTEYLREWSDAHGRPPRAPEQAAVAEMQRQRISAATHVIADTTPLVTAVYSDVLFQDSSLYPAALDFQRSLSLTLLTGLDLPWVADGIQRDGVVAQQRIDARLREVLLEARIPFVTIYGQGLQRLQATLQALDRLEGAGNSDYGTSTPWVWVCDSCSDPECEHRLFSRLRDQ